MRRGITDGINPLPMLALVALGFYAAMATSSTWAFVRPGPTHPATAAAGAAGGRPCVTGTLPVHLGTPSPATSAGAPESCSTPPNPPSNLTVSNLLTNDCSLNLTWTSGSSNCSGTITYNVYRGVTPDFTPDPTPGTGNLIASGLAVTVYEDQAALDSANTYYYLVRSVDSVSGEETNTTYVSGSPGATSGVLTEEFEPNGNFQNIGWTIQVISSPGSRPDPDPWMASQPGSYLYDSFTGTGTRFDMDWPIGTYPAFPNSGQDPGGERALVSPVWNISSSSVLTFWHTWSFENNYTPVDGYTPSYNCHDCYDGAVLEYKHPSDVTWTRISTFASGGYNGAIDAYGATNNPLGVNIPAWVGGEGIPSQDPVGPPSQPYIQTVVDIGALAGPGGVQVRWLQSGDTGNAGGGYIGWYIDDVRVTSVFLGGTCATLNACTAPGAPDLTSATGAVCGIIDLAWTAGSGTTSSYNIYRSVFSGGPYQKINSAPVSGLTYSDTMAALNTTYYYVVRGACDAYGVYESSNSNERSAISGPFTAPAAPGAPSFSNSGATSVSVNWDAVAGAVAYDLYRADGGCGGSGASIATNLTSTTYGDSSLAPSSTYGYYIIAKNNCGSSPNGTCAAFTTSAPPPWTPHGDTSGAAVQGLKNNADASTIHVTWDATCAATDYEIVYGMGSQLPTSYSGTYGVSGVECSIGAGGATDWTGVPDPSGDTSRFLWFLVVGTDGRLTEGPWGLNSGDLERMGPGTHGSSGNLVGCARTDKVTTNDCGR